MPRRDSAPTRSQPADAASPESGRRSVGSSSPKQSKDFKLELCRGLFDFLDANGDGVLEEHEWSLGCKDSRSFFRGRAQPALVTEVFNKLDSEGVGSLVFEDVQDSLDSLSEAMGIPSEQGLEALHILRARRASELRAKQSEGMLDPTPQGSSNGDEAEQTTHTERSKQQQAQAARVCSERRAQVLRKFLGVLPEQDCEKNDELPLGIRAKAAAQRVVTGGKLEEPPKELDARFSLDGLYVGGESVFVSAEVSVAKSGFDGCVESKRVPVDLLIVVDISGSMNSALPSVRKCLAELRSLVDASDSISLVKFDDKADIVMPWTSMDEQGINQFISAQAELVSRGGTCFLPVFDLCFNELLKDDCPGRSRSILFISDGVPSERESDIMRSVSKKLSLSNLSIVAAGFGTGTKANLMSAIAQCGCGPFVYIPETKDIPEQLGRIWASVAYTSLSSSFAVVRPLGGARVLNVEGAFGTAELSLRLSGGQSSEQVLIVQMGSVKHGASREVVFQLQLPESLRPSGMDSLSKTQLRQPLLEVSLISQAVSAENPVYLQQAVFRALQVPSMLMDTLLPFPVRVVLDNELEEFNAESFLKKTAATLGVAEDELELTRLLRGSVIVDMHLKVAPLRASGVLEKLDSSELREAMREAMEEEGYKLKAMSAPGQKVFRRLLQTRFADALGAAACDESAQLKSVHVLAASDVAQCLDPQGPSSMAAAIATDCADLEEQLKKATNSSAREHFRHNLVQLQAAHVAQYKCQSVAQSLECYELPEAQEAAEVMTHMCGDISFTAEFWETVQPKVEALTYESTADQFGVMVVLQPKPNRLTDFSHLVQHVSPVFKVEFTAEANDLHYPCVSYAHPVKAKDLLPIMRRSKHPSLPTCRIDDCVRVPFAQRLRVTIDPRTCRHGGSLGFYSDAMRSRPLMVVNRSVRDSFEFSYDGSEIWFSFRPDLDVLKRVEWGYHFEVEAVMPSKALPGLLLQATFVNLIPGPGRVSVRPVDRMIEAPLLSIQTLELRGSSEDRQAALDNLQNELDKRMVLKETACATLGFNSRVRLLCMNAEPLQSKQHLKSLASDQKLMGSTCNTVAQMTWTSDNQLFNWSAEDLLKAKLKCMKKDLSTELNLGLDCEIPLPRQPELVGWSWNGSALQLSWLFGWPLGSCALEVKEVDTSSLLLAQWPGAFYMITPEVTVAAARADAGIREPARTVALTVPFPDQRILKLELKHYAPPGHPSHVRHHCQFKGWLVPMGFEDSLLRLLHAENAGNRKLWQGPLASLVEDRL